MSFRNAKEFNKASNTDDRSLFVFNWIGAELTIRENRFKIDEQKRDVLALNFIVLIKWINHAMLGLPDFQSRNTGDFYRAMHIVQRAVLLS